MTFKNALFKYKYKSIWKDKCTLNEGIKIGMEILKKLNCNIYYYEMKKDAIGED